MKLSPFAVESYGGVGPAARKQLAARSDELTAQAFLSDALTRLSVALQRGNAVACGICVRLRCDWLAVTCDRRYLARH